jgi:hypothetical protein
MDMQLENARGWKLWERRVEWLMLWKVRSLNWNSLERLEVMGIELGLRGKCVKFE